MSTDRQRIHDARAGAVALVAYSLFYVAFFAQSFLSGQLIALSDSLDFGVAAYLSSPALWTEGMYSGYPIAADPQSLTWYPLLHLFRLLRLDWNLFLIAAYVLTATTSFLLIRRLTGSMVAAAFGGLIASFNAMMLAYLANFNQVHAFAWVPLVFYGLQLVREGHPRQGFAVTASATALMWLAGHPQIAVYTTYAAALLTGATWTLEGRTQPRDWRTLIWAGAAVAVGVAIAAVVILPALELGAWSDRASAKWELYISSAYPARELLTLVVPFAFGGFWSSSGVVQYLGESGDSAYIGLLPFALALASPVLASPHRRQARLWMALAVMEALLALGPATPLGTFFFYVPGYARFQAPVRHLFLVSLSLTVCASYVLAELIRTRRMVVVTWSALAAMLVGAVGLGTLGVSSQPIRDSLATTSVHALWAVAWPVALGVALVLTGLLGARLVRGPRAGSVWATVLIGLCVVDLSAFHYRIPGYRFVYGDVRREESVPRPRVAALRDELSRTGERVLATDGSKNPFVLPNLTRPWNVRAATGSGSLALAHYVDVLRPDSAGAVPQTVLSQEHAGVTLFAVRYALVREDAATQWDVARASGRWDALERWQYYEDDEDTRYVLLRNRENLSTAWCAPTMLQADRDATLRAIATGTLPDGQPVDFRHTALVEPGAVTGGVPAATNGPTPLVARTTEREFRVQTSAPCVLTVSEVFYPWWRGSIDEQSARVVRVNHALVGVIVPAGLHVVRLSLLPLSVLAGALLSVCGIIATIGVVLWPRLRRRA